MMHSSARAAVAARELVSLMLVGSADHDDNLPPSTLRELRLRASVGEAVDPELVVLLCDTLLEQRPSVEHENLKVEHENLQLDLANAEEKIDALEGKLADLEDALSALKERVKQARATLNDESEAA